MKPHPIAEIVPAMSEGEYAALRDDIAEHGQIEPVVTHDDLVLDGRHRERACEELGIEVRRRQWQGECGSPAAFVLSMAAKRRHLTVGQKAMLAAAMLPHLEEAARKRQATSTGGKRPQLTDPGREAGSPGEAIDQAGAPLGISGKSVARAREVTTTGAPELSAAVRSGALPLKPAAELATLPPDEQRRLLDKLDPKAVSAKAKELREARARVSRQKKNARADELRAKPLPMPDGRFDVIEVDWPWEHELRKDDDSQRGKGDYPRMSLDQICAMAPEVAKRAAQNCVLFTWWPNSHMKEAILAIEACGFRQVGNITWRKVTKSSRGKAKRQSKIGLGHYGRNVTEQLAICVRGSPLVTGESVENFFEAELREHSRKPEEAYELIERLCPGTKLQLFGREPRKGWVVWGAEAEKFAAGQGAAARAPEKRSPRTAAKKLSAEGEQVLAEHHAALQRAEKMVAQGTPARRAAEEAGVAQSELADYLEAGADAYLAEVRGRSGKRAKKAKKPAAKPAKARSSAERCQIHGCSSKRDGKCCFCEFHGDIAERLFPGSRFNLGWTGYQHDAISAGRRCEAVSPMDGGRCTRAPHRGNHFSSNTVDEPEWRDSVPAGRGARAASVPGPSRCIVPDCPRRGAARKLCAPHYRKAGRLGFTGELTAEQLAELHRDGRAAKPATKPAARRRSA